MFEYKSDRLYIIKIGQKCAQVKQEQTPEGEKYIIKYFDGDRLEGVETCDTLKQAKKKAKQRTKEN